MTRVLMTPHVKHVRGKHGGINRVVEAYFKYLPEFGIELVDDTASDYDLIASHIQNRGQHLDVLHCHGLYWSNDYPVSTSHAEINRRIIDAARRAKAITVPSRWVAKSFERDMRLTPHVIGHGIDYQLWNPNRERQGYTLWNKNRVGDACDPRAVTALALQFPSELFVTTFKTDDAPRNVQEIGTMEHAAMKRVIEGSSLYLSTARETFCIGVLEAYASGVPVLGWDIGGNRDLVVHGETGYLAPLNNYDALTEGYAYCMEHWETLSDNARELVKEYTWWNVCEQVAGVYEMAMESDPPTVGIVIPVYNKPKEVVQRAIQSAADQTYARLKQIVVVDDGSKNKDEVKEAVQSVHSNVPITLVQQPNRGVAFARNRGISELDTKYVCCLDADDKIKPGFIRTLITPLEQDKRLGISYSGLEWTTLKSGYTRKGRWPKEFSYRLQMEGQNQVPTCCVFRKDAWDRLGGYRQRYAPDGCGSEDAEFWLRIGSIGYDAIFTTEEPLFVYTIGGGTWREDYKETDWLSWHPWIRDGQHPFASIAEPANRLAHPVRQYDSPLVSVVIPVGPNHEINLIEALDSLEAQTVREWEAIVVWNTGQPVPNDLLVAYPYVEWVEMDKAVGAGRARNEGAYIAKSPFLLFLDADDFLKPECLEIMLEAWGANRAIVYTDYEAHRRGVGKEEAKKFQRDDRLLHYDGDYAVYVGRAAEFDPARIPRQPENPPYLWNLITSLVPKAWHDEIGGFDEEAPSWEDWDYWVRMAAAEKPFVLVRKPLVVYLYFTGGRRETGYELGGHLLEYYAEKYRSLDMSCRGCGQKPVYKPRERRPAPPVRNPSSGAAMPNDRRVEVQSRGYERAPEPKDEEFVRVRYTSPNKGNHPLWGTARFERHFAMPNAPGSKLDMRRNSDGTYSIFYGYRRGGEILVVHRSDADLNHFLQPIEEFSGPQVDSLPPVPQSAGPTMRTDAAQIWEQIQRAKEETTKRVEVAGDPPDDAEFLARLEAGQDVIGTSAPVSDLAMLPLPPEALVALKQAGADSIEDLKYWTEDNWMQLPKMDEGRVGLLMTMVRNRVEAVQMVDKTEKIPYNDRDIGELPLTPTAEATLREMGVDTFEDVSDWDEQEWTKIPTIGSKRAKAIIEAVLK